MNNVFVIHYELGDELVIRHVFSASIHDAYDWAQANKPKVLDVDPEEWKVDFVAPAQGITIPSTVGEVEYTTVHFRHRSGSE